MSDPPATDPNAAPTTETIAEATAVAERVRAVQARIAAAAEAAHRPADSIQLVAVSKRQPVSRIVAAVAAGVRVLGENYVQEARAKRPEVEAALTALGYSTSEARTAVSNLDQSLGSSVEDKIRQALQQFGTG